MMSIFILILGSMRWRNLFLIILSLCGSAQIGLSQARDVQWIIDLTDEVLDESDLCERCTWVSPIITQVRSAGRTFFFFRYSCSIDQAFSRMYSVAGDIVGECVTDGDDVSCMGTDAYTVYTFAEDITKVWTCLKGFECDFATQNEIEQEVPIAIDDSRCAEGIKRLSVSEEYADFQWSGPGINSQEPSIEVDRSATYAVTVTDPEGCVFTSETDIEVSSLEVRVKGPNRFCHQESALIGLTGFVSYDWSTGEQDSMIMVDAGGTYQVKVINELGCKGVGSFELMEDRPLSLRIITDQTDIIEGDTISVTYSSDPAAATPVSFQWFAEGTLTCRQCSSATFIPLLDNALMLTVEDDQGCFSEASASISVQELNLDVYVPNAIHSASQSGNDRFMIYGAKSIRRIERLAIYDRWGDLVYIQKKIKANSPSKGWNGYSNGVPYTEDVYSYVADILFINGKRKSISGDFMLFH